MLRPAVSLMPSVIENHVAVRESTKYSNRKKFLLWSKYVFPYKHALVTSLSIISAQPAQCLFFLSIKLSRPTSLIRWPMYRTL